MNFEFSEEQMALREQARRLLTEREALARCRAALDAQGGFDAALWQELADLGWLGATVPQAHGGAGLGYLDLCVIAQELGRVNAALPFASSVYLATEALLRFGNDTQRATWLPRLVAGAVVGTLAAAEGPGALSPGRVQATVQGGRLRGAKTPVWDGAEASLVVVLARDSGGLGLYLVEADAASVTRTSLSMNDASRPAAALEFTGTPAERLGAADAWQSYQNLLDRAAILMSFEQIGGAEACLEMACNYARERYAFGRPIGSFQAIKHKLADVYVALELARSNAYYGAWALGADAPELPLAAAAARVAACKAFDLAAKENIQTHGGMGFTWAFDCHLYYRRAKTLGLNLGAARVWKEQLVERLERRNAS